MDKVIAVKKLFLQLERAGRPVCLTDAVGTNLDDGCPPSSPVILSSGGQTKRHLDSMTAAPAADQSSALQNGVQCNCLKYLNNSRPARRGTEPRWPRNADNTAAQEMPLSNERERIIYHQI